ncbi:uncharacterized protein LOC142539715 [Primulina tabacum]|uniref:uncharacterized protein LOC142539715 n=1 Tax=Primulina tabacum TaxID=48773 RepID=UPI003F59D8E2
MQSAFQEMPSVVEGEEVFFDTKDRLTCDEFFIVKGDSVCSRMEYDMWLSKPLSVKERREIFLSKFFEDPTNGEFERMDIERAAESSASSSASVDETFLCERRQSNSEARSSVDYSDQDWLDEICINREPEIEESLENGRVSAGESLDLDKKNKNVVRWWKHLVEKMKRQRSHIPTSNTGKMARVRIEQNRKKCMECSAVYTGQQINAHNGLIWTMKFSSDGQFLASGGEDGVICIWRVSTVDSSCKTVKCDFGRQGSVDKSGHKKNIACHTPVIPEKIFHIEEEPLHKLKGHSGKILDLAWSSSNHLLSASTDKTVRLWQVGSEKCLGVFHHCNYVTCVQFNPVDETYFISGSIDGKVRIWGVHKKRVEDWANIRDLVTAVCYQPNGEGFVVGSVSGTCRFFERSEGELLLKAMIKFRGKKSSGNKITGIQFLKNNTRRVMITSEDSKIRVLDGLEVVRKYRGRAKSGCQMSASFTSNGRHIVSVGDNSRVYLWNYDDPSIQKIKHTKSIRSCEHLFIEGVSVAIPWKDLDTDCNMFPLQNCLKASPRSWDLERFSLANWFSMDSSSRGSVTWPEEKLPLWDPLSSENDCHPCKECGDHIHQELLHKNNSRIVSATWGLVFVTAGWDGTIRTFHNYGLPVQN